MLEINRVPNIQIAEGYKENHEKWKKEAIEKYGYFILFKSFENNNILKNISGNALKLYVYFGIHSDNYTGECWITIETIAKYFNKSTRTINYWIRELEDKNLIKRMQLKINGPSHTYLQPYSYV